MPIDNSTHNSPAENPAASTGGGNSMPFMDEYLRTVLQPRVQELIDKHSGSWEQLALRVISEELAKNPEAGTNANANEISRMLTEQLGLKLAVEVRACFSNSKNPSTDEAGAASAPTHTTPDSDADIIDVDFVKPPAQNTQHDTQQAASTPRPTSTQEPKPAPTRIPRTPIAAPSPTPIADVTPINPESKPKVRPVANSEVKPEPKAEPEKVAKTESRTRKKMTLSPLAQAVSGAQKH